VAELSLDDRDRVTDVEPEILARVPNVESLVRSAQESTRSDDAIELT
jgi:hypothetical protein